ncbi:MAG: hypothetical protein IJQ16_04850, partial [Selenomonadaceae bacterium]|nr:hypothetical protein [Selenomonadaceae bacterium]
ESHNKPLLEINPFKCPLKTYRRLTIKTVKACKKIFLIKNAINYYFCCGGLYITAIKKSIVCKKFF